MKSVFAMKHKQTYQRHDLIGPGASAADIRKAFAALRRSLSALSPDGWAIASIEEAIQRAATGAGVPTEAFQHSLGVAFGIRTYADISRAVEKMGQQEALRRIQHAVDLLSVVANAQ